MNKTLAIAVLLLTSVASFAQSSSHGGGSGSGVGISTVAAAPTGKAPGTLNVMIDGSTGTDCTVGGGANFVLCRYSGTVWGTFTAGTAGAGGAASTLQFSNAGTLGGISQFTTNGTTTITGSATSVFDLHAAGVGGLLLPGALATGIVKVTTGTGAISILAAPTGAILGTSDTQVVSHKDFTDVTNTFPTFNQNTSGSAAKWTTPRSLAGNSVDGSADVAFANKFIVQGTVDAGLSGAQFLGALGTGLLKNTTTTGVLSVASASDVVSLLQGLTGCNTATFVFTPQANDCVAQNSGFSNPMTTIGDMIGGGASGAGTRIVGGKTGQVVVATDSATPAFSSPGLADGNGAAPVTTTPYAVQCDSSTALIDRQTVLRLQSGASVVTSPDHTATGCGGSFLYGLLDDGGGSITVNRGGTDTFSVFDGSTNTDGATSFTLTNGQFASINNGAGSVWEVRITKGGGGSLSGMTAGQVPIAATASTVTSSEVLSGTGAGITTGPTSSTTLDVTEFTGTGGQIADSAVAVANLTQTTATPSANQICVYGSTAKTCTPTTTLPAAAIPTAIPIANVGSAGLSGTSPVTISAAGAIGCSTCNTTAAVANPPLDKSGTGLSNPTADATFTQPIGSTVGITLNGTAPASVSTATGTNGSSILVVTAPTGGADSNATGTAGIGGSPAITAGAGGAGTGTNAVGGAGGSVTLTAGNGGASLGTGANANGGNVVIIPGTAGSGGSGTAGKTGALQVGSSAPAPVIGTAGGNMAGEGTAPTGLSANDTWYANSTNHCFDLINQTTDVGCALGNNGTNTAGASMTLDMSAATGATAFKVPVIAGATAGANGVVDYDSTNNNTHIRTNGADSLAVGEAAAVGANIILKATDGTHSLATASSISDGVTAGLTSTANMLKGGNTVRLTANATAITATTPGTTVLTFGALPVSTNFSFHCSILYNQQTAAVAGTGFAVQGATNAPTRLDAWGSMFTSNAGAAAEGVLQNLATTTATSVVTGTPSAITTVFQATLDGSIQVGASASTLNIAAFTGNASDSITIQAGSYCTLTP